MIENLKDYRHFQKLKIVFKSRVQRFQKLSGMVVPGNKNKGKIVSAGFHTYYAKSESLNNRTHAKKYK
jgi:hypothetical protein